MKRGKKIALEIILILSGVLIFRSLWTLMDQVQIFNENYTHLTLLIFGILISIIAYHKLTSKK